MRTTTIILLLTLALAFPIAAWSADPGKPIENPDDPPIVLNPPTPKPHTEDGSLGEDSEVLAYISSDKESLTIVFPQDKGLVCVELMDIDGTSLYRAYHPSSFPISIDIAPTAFPLIIEVTTSDGTQYCGLLP